MIRPVGFGGNREVPELQPDLRSLLFRLRMFARPVDLVTLCSARYRALCCATRPRRECPARLRVTTSRLPRAGGNEGPLTLEPAIHSSHCHGEQMVFHVI
jgi:hypothetical protein